MTILRLLMSNRWAQGLALVVAGVALALLLDRCAARIMSSAKDAGQAEQQAIDMRETIKQVEKANAASEKWRRNGGPPYDDCLLDSRTLENC